MLALQPNRNSTVELGSGLSVREPGCQQITNDDTI